jgi:hypothetical protein
VFTAPQPKGNSRIVPDGDVSEWTTARAEGVDADMVNAKAKRLRGKVNITSGMAPAPIISIPKELRTINASIVKSQYPPAIHTLFAPPTPAFA